MKQYKGRYPIKKKTQLSKYNDLFEKYENLLIQQKLKQEKKRLGGMKWLVSLMLGYLFSSVFIMVLVSIPDLTTINVAFSVWTNVVVLALIGLYSHYKFATILRGTDNS